MNFILINFLLIIIISTKFMLEQWAQLVLLFVYLYAEHEEIDKLPDKCPFDNVEFFY